MNKSHDSFISRLRVACSAGLSTSVSRINAHVTDNEIIEALSFEMDGISLYLPNNISHIDTKSQVDLISHIDMRESGNLYDTVPTVGARRSGPNIMSIDSIMNDIPDSYQDAITGLYSGECLIVTEHKSNGLTKLKSWFISESPTNQSQLS